MVRTVSKDVETTGQGDVRDISASVRQAVSESSFLAGIATVAVVGSTAGITTIEYEPGAVADFNRLLEQLAPRSRKVLLEQDSWFWRRACFQYRDSSATL